MSKQKRTWDVILVVVMVLLCLLWIYTIVLIMLWMYFCMYSILLGGELNIEMYDKLFTGKRDKKERTEEE